MRPEACRRSERVPAAVTRQHDAREQPRQHAAERYAHDGAVTASVRRRAGVNSAVMVVALGSAPPIPSPAKKRRIAMVVTSGDSAIELVAKPNTSTLPMMAQRRPNLSANSPANALPIPMPTRPAATAGANALRVMPHSLIRLGMANPMSCPSNPSITIASAASNTTVRWNAENGPSSRVRPMSTVGRRGLRSFISRSPPDRPSLNRIAG